MSTRSWTLDTAGTLLEWNNDAASTGQFVFSRDTEFDTLDYDHKTTDSVQYIPSTATVTNMVGTSWMVGADHIGFGAANTVVLKIFSDTTELASTSRSIVQGDAPSYNNASAYTVSGTCTPAQAKLFSIRHSQNLGNPPDPPGTWDNQRVRLKLAAGGMDGVAPAVVVTFTLAAPVATTGSATNITPSSATLNATLNPSGANTHYPVSYKFQWGLTTSYGNETTLVADQVGSANIAVSANISGLVDNTTYHFRLQATNADNTINGLDSTFINGGGGPTGDSSVMVF